MDTFLVGREKGGPLECHLKYDDYVYINLVTYSLNTRVETEFVPNTYQEAITCPNSDKWKIAMDKEIASWLRQNFVVGLKTEA